jgi:hypothetical protein
MTLIIAAVILFLVLPRIAAAYIDLGTGSYLLQILAGVFLGSLYALKIYWKKITAFFSSIKQKTETKSED